MRFPRCPLSPLVLTVALLADLTACTTRLISADEEISSDTSSDLDDEPSSTGSESEPPDPDSPPEAPKLQLSFSQSHPKQFEFSWTPGSGAQYYQLLESVNGAQPYEQVGDDLLGLTASLTVSLYEQVNSSYVVRACNDLGCTDSEVVQVMGVLAEAIGYFKASNTDAEDQFGVSVALSGDGKTLAVGTILEASDATDQTDDSAPHAGAVYVFVRNEQGLWSQQAYVKSSNTDAGEWFGCDVALSEDGNLLAVGAPGGIYDEQPADFAETTGAVYMFVRNGQGEWAQQAHVKASNADLKDFFGGSVALTGDGNTLAVGAPGEGSSTTGIDGDSLDDSIEWAGAVYVFARDDEDQWLQQAYVKASNTDQGDMFGHGVALSNDGNTLAVGAHGEDSNATAINGSQANGPAGEYGAVYVFTRNGLAEWSQQAYIKTSSIDDWDSLGYSVTLSGDGNTLAAGAFGESSSATGIGGDQADNATPWAGAVFVFARDGLGEWSQQAYVKASNSGVDDWFGMSLALSEDGNTLAVGTREEDSQATGIDGNQADDSATLAGAVYVFVRSGLGEWSQQAYVKASNSDAGDSFGSSVALSGDGNSLAVGATGEASNATGIGGDQTDNSAPRAGAVYLY
jgi:hypothetical protein